MMTGHLLPSPPVMSFPEKDKSEIKNVFITETAVKHAVVVYWSDLDYIHTYQAKSLKTSRHSVPRGNEKICWSEVAIGWKGSLKLIASSL